MKFIKLTECYNAPKEIYINVEMIGAIQTAHDRENCTKLKHLSHNNGGYYIKETPEEILKLIKELN
jgi:hypothetical protein